MPYNAYLYADIFCPSCNVDITNFVSFRWGYCRGSVPVTKYIYELGNAIYWRPCKDGSTHSWIAFDDGGANIGDITINDIVVRDVAHHYEKYCVTCLQPIGGVATEIRNGIITRSWCYLPDELDNNASIFLIDENSILKPISEWDSHSLALIENC